MITLLLADDHPIIKDGLIRWIDMVDDLKVLGTAASLPELHAQLEMHTPDVLVLDYRMPGMQGVESIRALCAHPCRIVMFTSTEEQAIIHALCESGIDGFVHKSTPIASLINVVRQVAAGKQILPNKSPDAQMPHETLSEREKIVFLGLIRQQSPKEIAFELGVATSSVYTYAERVRTKLNVQDTRALIQYAYEVGLLETATQS